MKKSSPLMGKWFAGISILILGTSVVYGQFSKPKIKPSKLLLGVVVDQDDNPIPTAVVSLVNFKTQKISQDITDDKGEFRFAGLSPDIDYELQAVYHNYKGPKERISIYDTRAKREFYWKLPIKIAEASQELDVSFLVSDEQGRGIPGATLKLTSPSKIETLAVSTDANGRADQWLSPARTYSIVVEAKGYETYVQEAYKPERRVAGLQIALKAAK